MFTKNYFGKKIFLSFATILFLANPLQAAEPWNSKDGIERLNQSEYKSDFYQLAGFFQPQINPLFCGVASSVIVLNAIGNKENNIESQKALEAIRPLSVGGGTVPFKSYSQITFLNDATDKIKDRKIIRMENMVDDKQNVDGGFTLSQLSSVLSKVYKLNAKVHYVSKVNDKEVGKFRNLLKEILVDQDKFIIANFIGKNIELKSGGHISPLVAYDQINDSVLILDVAGHLNSWVWVPLEDLYKSMNTKDGEKYRGYLIVSGQK